LCFNLSNTIQSSFLNQSEVVKELHVVSYKTFDEIPNQPVSDFFLNPLKFDALIKISHVFHKFYSASQMQVA